MARAAEQEAEKPAERPVDYQVFEADIIVIGAGMAAMCAVDEAIHQGQNVLVIDKAPFGFGGASGMNWDVCYTWNPAGTSAISGSIRNNNLVNAANESDRYGTNNYVNIINMGEVCPQRNEDGTVHFKMDFPYTQMVEWGFPRHWNDQMGQRGNVTVHDYTMITDIFVNDGRCIGCVGVYLPTGEYRVYRSKATVLSTGGCTQMYGWVTLSSVTNQSTDNTADVDMGIFRHGGRIGDAEHGAYDMMGIYPTCWASSEGAMFGGDSMDIDFMLDNEGVAFCLDPELDQERMMNDRPYFNQIVAKHIQDGKGGPNGGIFLPATTEMREQMRYMYLRCVNRIEAQCGIDLTEEPMECMIEMYEHGGTPLIDDQMMSTEFAGLFCSRGAGSFGVGGGATNITERQYGQYAMKNAIAYAQSAEPLAEVDFSDAEREIARLEELRTREAEDGIRPVTIQREIAGAVLPGPQRGAHAGGARPRPRRPAPHLRRGAAAHDLGQPLEHLQPRLEGRHRDGEPARHRAPLDRGHLRAPREPRQLPAPRVPRAERRVGLHPRVPPGRERRAALRQGLLGRVSPRLTHTPRRGAPDEHHR